jgi:tRNA(fMet)-specific endonuclease VapC
LRLRRCFGCVHLTRNWIALATLFWATYRKFVWQHCRVAILVDTGALELLRRRDRKAESTAIRFYPPVICCHVVAEFLYGQILSKVPSSTLLRAQEFLDSFEMLIPDRSTAGVYARIRASLKSEGQILPDPDYWIAAHALEEQIPLLSTDTHFTRVPDLDLRLIS